MTNPFTAKLNYDAIVAQYPLNMMIHDNARLKYAHTAVLYKMAGKRKNVLQTIAIDQGMMNYTHNIEPIAMFKKRVMQYARPPGGLVRDKERVLIDLWMPTEDMKIEKAQTLVFDGDDTHAMRVDQEITLAQFCMAGVEHVERIVPCILVKSEQATPTY